MDETAPDADSSFGTAQGPGTWQVLGDRVWRTVAQPESVTVGLVAGSDGAVLIDTGSTAEQGAALRAAAERVAGVAVVAVALTHAHADHVGGLGAFGDVARWGSEGLGPAMPPGLPAPDHTFGVGRAVVLGDRIVELIAVGRAHTDHDVIAVVADAKVVFAGDLAEPAGPEFGPDADPESWPGALDHLIGLMLRPGWRAVPGHGDPVGMSELVMQRGRIATVFAEATRLVTEGVPYEAAADAGDWPFDWEKIADGVRTSYRMLADRGVVAKPRLPIIRVDTEE